MKQYTTQNLQITLDDAETLLDQCVALSVYLKGNVVLDFAKNDVLIEGNVVTVPLTQEETGELGPGNVRIEVTLRMGDGSVLKTNTVTAPIEEALRKELL